MLILHTRSAVHQHPNFHSPKALVPIPFPTPPIPPPQLSPLLPRSRSKELPEERRGPFVRLFPPLLRPLRGEELGQLPVRFPAEQRVRSIPRSLPSRSPHSCPGSFPNHSVENLPTNMPSGLKSYERGSLARCGLRKLHGPASHPEPTSEPRKHEGHEAERHGIPEVRFTPFWPQRPLTVRVFVAVNAGSRSDARI